jgi:hypothetical protein
MKKIDNIHFVYVPAAKTNVADTFKRLGFELPSNDKKYQKKWNTYKQLAWRNEQ